jgi:hypothetical protein
MMARKRKPSKKNLAVVLEAAVSHADQMLHEDFSSISKLAARSKKVGNRLEFDNGWTIVTKTEDWLGKRKNFYDVYAPNSKQKEAGDLGLFMSAMALVNASSSRRAKKILDAVNIVRADQRYQHHLNDAAMFGLKLRTQALDEFKRDFYNIRLEEAMINCQSAKRELRSYI